MTIYKKQLILVTVCYFFGMSSVVASKPECLGYHKKLQNIQSQQRQGNSGKQANKLAEKEKKARDKWWQCQQGKLKDKKKLKSKKA